MIFEVWGNRKSIKNRSKIGPTVDGKRDPQNGQVWKRFWVDFGAKLGLERGAKTGQDRPRQEKQKC